MTRILVAASELPPLRGGVARSAGRLAADFAAAGHQVETLSIAHAGRLALGEMRLTGLVLKWPAIRNKLGHVDVVSVHGPAPTFSDALLVLLRLRRRRMPVVYTHNFDVDFPGISPLSSLYSWAHRQLVRLADHVIVTTPAYGKSFAWLGRDRVTIAPLGVDQPLELTPPEKSDGFTVLFVGQLRPYKSVDTLIRAAKHVPDARILIAGDGPERAGLERLAGRLGASNVSFLGAVPDEELPGLYGQAHVVTLPSKSKFEGFGITLVEGMALGCVPVASSLLGVTDVVQDVGFTFPPRDSSALGRILADLASDRNGWARLSERAREQSRQYTWERTVAAYLSVFASVLGSGPTVDAQAPQATL